MKSLHTRHRAQSEMKTPGSCRGNGIVYARANRWGQKRPLGSLPIQIESCRKAMERDGVIEVLPPILDVASGMDFRRRGLRRLLRLAEEGRIGYVYVQRRDRLGRDVVKTLNLIVQLKELDVIVRSAS
jgi:DNA invertase Pin-like site-specific DNA recombinase